MPDTHSTALPDRPVLTDKQRLFFDLNGYIVLKGFFAPGRVAAMKAHLDALWRNRATGFPFTMDVFLDDPRNGRTYFTQAPDEARQHPYKLNDLHLEDRVVQDFATDPRLLAVLRQLLAADPLACNTLLLEYGSQQGPHFDTFYMPSPTPNKMMASWIAFDPVTETNGPLFYYPGSHRVPPYLFSHGSPKLIAAEWDDVDAHMHWIATESGLRREEFFADPGDVLLWHAQLLHGGSPIRNPGETRLSLVTHYWTQQDFPRADQRIELGDGRNLFRREHQFVLSGTAADEIAAFLRGLATPPADRAAVPPEFDAQAYLVANPDVFARRTDPYTHYAHYGRAEGRNW